LSPADVQRVRDVRRALSDPVKLCAALGLVERWTQRQAGGVTIRCPWHDERNPSCSVTRAADGTVRARCFACGASGDALTLVARIHGLDVRRDFRGVLAVAATIAGMHGVCADLEVPRERSVLDDATFHAVASELVERCPFDAENDVLHYLDRRVLLVAGAQARLFALPAPERQGGLLTDLARLFSPEALALAGLVKRGDDGRPVLGRFVWPVHRVGIPWRSPDGRIQTVQRRRLNDGERKYVFPSGRAPRFPFGVEAMAWAGPDTQLVFCEGAFDALALRLLARRDGHDLFALGLPGARGWRSEWASLASGRVALVALDPDAAGLEAREAVKADLFGAGARRVLRFQPRGGAKDWAAYVEGLAA